MKYKIVVMVIIGTAFFSDIISSEKKAKTDQVDSDDFDESDDFLGGITSDCADVVTKKVEATYLDYVYISLYACYYYGLEKPTTLCLAYCKQLYARLACKKKITKDDTTDRS